MNKEIFVGITKDNELISLELNYNDLNKGTKWYNPHYYLSHHGYRDIVDAEKGEEDARDRLADEEYWRDLGYLGKNIPNVLSNNIDWDEVAEDTINSDGWEMINGEYYEIGEYDGKTYYINLGSVGFEREHQRKNFKKLFVTEEEFKFLLSKDSWKNKDKDLAKLKALFDKPQNLTKIIKAFLEVGEYAREE